MSSPPSRDIVIVAKKRYILENMQGFMQERSALVLGFTSKPVGTGVLDGPQICNLGNCRNGDAAAWALRDPNSRAS